jgi:hypothetical protein
MSTTNIVVAVNTVQTVVNDATNIVAYETTVYEPIISAAQGPQGIPGISASTSIAELTDTSLDNLTNGSILVYDTYNQVWVATKQLTYQAIECGQY